MALSISKKDKYLRIFWLTLTAVLIGAAVSMFEGRNAERDLAVSDKGQKLYASTVENYPDTKPAIDALMVCIKKGKLKIDKNIDDEDLNRPRQACPKYDTAIEALHGSPMAMREMELAYNHLVSALKAKL